jgi:hypothetical protein
VRNRNTVLSWCISRFYGGKLNGQTFKDAPTVKKFARKSQLGEVLSLIEQV